MDLVERFGLDGVFAGDPGVSAAEQQRILRWCETGETDIPCTLAEGYRHLYGVPFTCRPDSPSWLVRFQESRQYAEPGREVAPAPAQPRPRGAITMDNALYGRYSGEIQLIRSSLPADERVNVIGAVSSRHMLLADRLHRGGKFRLVPVESNSTGWTRQRVCGICVIRPDCGSPNISTLTNKQIALGRSTFLVENQFQTCSSKDWT